MPEDKNAKVSVMSEYGTTRLVILARAGPRRTIQAADNARFGAKRKVQS